MEVSFALYIMACERLLAPPVVSCEYEIQKRTISKCGGRRLFKLVKITSIYTQVPLHFWAPFFISFVVLCVNMCKLCINKCIIIVLACFFLPQQNHPKIVRDTICIHIFFFGNLSNVKCLFMKCKIQTEINECELNDYFVKII